MAALFLLSSTLLAPYVVARDPKPAERAIAWQDLPPLKSIDDKAFREQIDQLKMDIDIYIQEHGAELNPALFEKKNRLAEFYYDNGKYDDALRSYNRLCNQGNKIFDEEFASTGSAPIIGHSLALANLNYSRCLLKRGVVGESSRTAKKGITCIGNSAGVDNGAGAYLNGVVALTALRLRADRVWADEPFSRFMYFINKQRQKANYAIGEENTGLTSEQSEEVAPLLAELGDAYSELGDVGTATKAYEAAKDAWRTLGKRGAYNLAVVNQRLGRLSAKSGDFDRAIGLLKNSANTFEALGGKNDLNRSKVLFDEADALWKDHKDPLNFNNKFDAFSTHAEAVSIWASQHSTKPR
jgi:tetratricopeptide (TPR) repeat protein